MPPEQPAQSDTDGLTPADTITPHDEGDATNRPAEAPPADPSPGIIDPRHLPGPDILEPPPPGLPLSPDE